MSRTPSLPRVSRAAGAAVFLLMTAGCGDSTGTVGAPEGGDEPVTARALAAVVAEHLGEPDGAGPEEDFEELGPDAVGAMVRYNEEDGAPATGLAIGVGSELPDEFGECPATSDSCVEVEGGVLAWQEQDPEEDPGGVYVVLTKGETHVGLFQSSEPVTGDPREMDLRISVEDMLAIARDPRVDLTTSQSALDAGEDLASWGTARDD